jgi:PAS domain S-box-containing protein
MKSNEHYKHFFNYSLDLCCLADINGHFIETSPSFSNVLGYTPEELKDGYVFQFIHPDDIAKTKDAFSTIQTDKKLDNFQNRYQKKNGDYIYLNWSAVYSEPHVYATARDVTTQVLAEATLIKQQNFINLITDNVPVLLAYIDDSLRYKYVNNNYYKWFKIKKEDVIGNYVSEVAGEKAFQKIKPKMEATLKGEIIQYKIDFENNNRTRHLHVSYLPDIKKDTSIPGFFCLIQDLTDDFKKKQQLIDQTTTLKKQATELKIAKQQADLSTKSQSQFLTNMSHELRTPLNSVIILSELLLQDQFKNLNDKQLEYASIIKQSGNELLELIDNLLDLSRIESGNMALDSDIISIEKFIDDLIVNHLLQSSKKGVQFKYNCDGCQEKRVTIDESKLKHIINNLLSNAIKFTPRGSISLTISQMNSELIIEVKDTGKGISKDKLSHIFSPFIQEDASINRKFGGTGLGLAIVKQMITLMGGSIFVESTEKVGSKFTAKVPYKKLQPTPPTSKSNIVAKNTAKILLVEDNISNIFSIQSLLDHYSISYEICKDGECAIDKLSVKENEFSLILLDIMLPKKNGYDVLNYIQKEKNTAPPVVILTAKTDDGEQDKCMELGASNFLNKPIQLKDLTAILEEYNILTTAKVT